jgi:hypothetical protein
MLPRISLGLLILLAGPGLLAADPKTDAIETALRAYCDRHDVPRGAVQSVTLSLAPKGSVFRYRLPAIEDKEKKTALGERYAVVFVDPESGNVFDVKKSLSDGYASTRQTLAILTLLGTRVQNEKEAEGVLRDLYRMDRWLTSIEPIDYRHNPETITVDGTDKMKPPSVYHGTHHGIFVGMDLLVDSGGFVTGVHWRSMR